MNQPTAPPPPPPAQYDAAPPPKKKGLSPLAWVGIGCGGLLVIALIVFVIGGMFVAKKARDVVGDFESNPAMAAAEMVVRVNPELELVESDREAGTLTVRNTRTGEVITLDLEDVENGNFGFNVDGEESTVSFGEQGIEVTSEEDGKTSTMKIGGSAGSDVPDWVPVYPGTVPASTFVSSSGGRTQGAFALNTDDQPEAVLDWYADEMSDLGIADPDRSSFQAGDTRGGSVSGSSGSELKLNVSAMAREGGTVITVTFEAAS